MWQGSMKVCVAATGVCAAVEFSQEFDVKPIPCGSGESHTSSSRSVYNISHESNNQKDKVHTLSKSPSSRSSYNKAHEHSNKGIKHIFEYRTEIVS